MNNDKDNNVNHSEEQNKNVTPQKRGGGPMGGGHGPMGMGEKAKDFKGSVKKLTKHLSKYKLQFILVFIFAIGSTLFTIVGPKILGNVTTELFNGLLGKIKGTGGIDFNAIGKTLFMLLGLYVISAILSLKINPRIPAGIVPTTIKSAYLKFL